MSDFRCCENKSTKQGVKPGGFAPLVSSISFAINSLGGCKLKPGGYMVLNFSRMVYIILRIYSRSDVNLSQFIKRNICIKITRI